MFLRRTRQRGKSPTRLRLSAPNPTADEVRDAFRTSCFFGETSEPGCRNRSRGPTGPPAACSAPAVRVNICCTCCPGGRNRPLGPTGSPEEKSSTAAFAAPAVRVDICRTRESAMRCRLSPPVPKVFNALETSQPGFFRSSHALQLQSLSRLTCEDFPESFPCERLRTPETAQKGLKMTIIEAEKPPIPKPPTGLKPRGRRVWRELHAVYDFTDAPEKGILLEEAARTADVVVRLQNLVDEAGHLRVSGSNGQPVAMPELAELRQYRALLASLLKSLTLPDDEESWTRSQLGKAGAAARWNRG
jgi:hypothetical protein